VCNDEIGGIEMSSRIVVYTGADCLGDIDATPAEIERFKEGCKHELSAIGWNNIQFSSEQMMKGIKIFRDWSETDPGDFETMDAVQRARGGLPQ
jgi:hypothetical protein